jgi:hypothetical protein
MNKKEFARKIAEIETEKMLAGEFCSICGWPFATNAEKDTAVCSGTHPLKFAHGLCWRQQNGEV